MTATYARGTATRKVTTLRAEGNTLLTFLVPGHDGLVAVADRKTGAELREVARIERVAPGAYEKNTRIRVHFTDGTHSANLSSSQTWMAVDAPEVTEEAPAEETAPLEVVTLDGEELSVEVTATPAPETKAYRIGKLLREFVLASQDDGHYAVSHALVDHVASRNVCYDGTATLRLTPEWTEELINAAAEMDAEAKAAARSARRVLYGLWA